MAEEYELQINSDALCRCCLAESSGLRSIFQCDIIDGEVFPLSFIYKNVTNLLLSRDDCLPQRVCRKCEAILVQSFAFKRKCIKSHDLVRGLFQSIDDKTTTTTTTVRSEPNDENFEVKVAIITSKTQNDHKLNNEEAVKIEPEEGITENSVEMEHTAIPTTNDDKSIGNNAEKSIDYNGISSVLPTDSEVLDTSNDEEIESACEYCGECFTKKSTLDTHMERHTVLRPLILSAANFYRCGRCLTIFLDDDSFQAHLDLDESCTKSAIPNDNDEYYDYQYLNEVEEAGIRLYSGHGNSNKCVCDICSSEFGNVLAFSQHVDETHPTQFLSSDTEYFQAERSHNCSLCESSDKNLQSTLHHIYFHQNELACTSSDCSERFTAFSILYEHVMKKHRICVPGVVDVCAYCQYAARSSSELIEHKRISCEKRRFECQYCDKKFFRKSTVFMHHRSHKNDKQFTCSICEKAFLQANDLTNHMRIHTSERPFKCQLCDKTFKTISQRNGHEGTHVMSNEYECTVCHRVMKSKRILRAHMKIHDEPQFGCSQCQRKFNRRYHLSLHMRLHSNQIPGK